TRTTSCNARTRRWWHWHDGTGKILVGDGRRAGAVAAGQHDRLVAGTAGAARQARGDRQPQRAHPRLVVDGCAAVRLLRAGPRHHPGVLRAGRVRHAHADPAWRPPAAGAVLLRGDTAAVLADRHRLVRTVRDLHPRL